MHDDPEITLLRELQRRLSEPGMSHRKLEIVLGLPMNELKGILDATQPRTPSVTKAKKIAEALGLEFHLGPPRQYEVASGRPVAPVFMEPDAAPDISQPQMSKDHFVSLPWHGPTAGIGSSPIAISTAWLAANNLGQRNLHAVIPDVVALANIGPRGIVAVIDAAASSDAGFGLWCYQSEGKTHLARLMTDKGVTIIFPGPTDSSPKIVAPDAADQIRILGKVVWLSFIAT